jgi:hypothetical protein
MYTSFYESDNNQDSILIANIIDNAMMQQKLKLDMTVQFMKNGCFAMLYLGKAHKSSWNICWFSDKPNIIDTGISMLSLADPNFQNRLIDNITKITMLMVAFCDCASCRQKVAEDYLPCL